jgi:hypothetical protein
LVERSPRQAQGIEARGDSRQAANCHRKVIDFIRQHDKLDPPGGELIALLSGARAC